MSTVDDGGPAFPTGDGVGSDEEKTVTFTGEHRGMSLRDWFAGQALVGRQCPIPNDADERARFAGIYYAMADAMLAERAKRG